MKKHIRLRTHPYTFARVSVMKAHLLKGEEYHTLMKMGLHEAINFIQERVCKEEKQELPGGKIGVGDVEWILNRHLEKVFDKLRRISKHELKLIINNYLKRYDVEDIKTILRAKYTNLPEEKISTLLFAAGALTREELQRCIEKESMQDVLKEASKLGVGGAVQNKSEQLGEIEDSLDRAYYHEMLELARRIPKDKFMKEFIEQELEIKSLINTLRVQQTKQKHQDSRQQTVPLPVSPGFRKRLELLTRKNIAEAPHIFAGTPYQKVLEEGLAQYQETQSLGKLKTMLRVWLLRKTLGLMKKKLGSIEYLFGYMFAKETEVKNLSIIIKGKQTGLEQSFIESQLVVRNG